MKKKSLIKEILAVIPLVFSGLMCIAIVFVLRQKLSEDISFMETLSNISTTIISISGFLAAIIMVYLASTVMSLKTARNSVVNELSTAVKKMNDFRSIIELLLRSKLWLPRLKEYIDEEYSGLTFFEVKEFYKGNSKLAIEFLQEKHDFAETENLYLELKSLLYTSHRDKKVSETISQPKVYDQKLIEKWLEHKCGSGLWYFFGYKYSVFKDALDLDKVYERHQDKIMTLALSIDNEAFEDSSFNEVFISKLGEYMTKEILPKLFQYQERIGQKVPKIMQYLYSIFMVLIIFGVLLPIITTLLGLSSIFLIVSVAVVISIIFFIATSFYQFLSSEAHI